MDIINKYINLKKDVMSYFNCKEDYFIKPLFNYNWNIINNEEIFFLTYWDNKNKTNIIIVKKNNIPLIYKRKIYTMVVGIDCIKIAFILENNNKK